MRRRSWTAADWNYRRLRGGSAPGSSQSLPRQSLREPRSPLRRRRRSALRSTPPAAAFSARPASASASAFPPRCPTAAAESSGSTRRADSRRISCFKTAGSRLSPSASARQRLALVRIRRENSARHCVFQSHRLARLRPRVDERIAECHDDGRRNGFLLRYFAIAVCHWCRAGCRRRWQQRVGRAIAAARQRRRSYDAGGIAARCQAGQRPPISHRFSKANRPTKEPTHSVVA